MNVKSKEVSKVKELVKKFGAKVLLIKKFEFIIEFAGTPSEITLIIKKLGSFKIIELTRSGLVSMALGTEYIKK